MAVPAGLHDGDQAEARRLAALQSYHILDTGPQEAFDHLVRRAADLTGAPIALIGLLDADRHWYKARIGVEFSELPRAQSLCVRVGSTERATAIADLSADPRLADHPLVVGQPFLRFYAGAPLTSVDGFHLGTLCTLDFAPRELAPEQLGELEALAAEVTATLELHRTVGLPAEHAATDKLTGRAALVADLAALVRPPQAPFVPFSLVYVGCTNLPAMRDTMGARAVDHLLLSLGEALADSTRQSDRAARVDAEEFALLLPATFERDAVPAAHRTLERGTELMLVNSWPATLSVGVATFSAAPANADHALSVAEAAMHQAKLRGNRQVCVARFPPSAGDPPPPALGLMQRALRSGLDRGELFLEYQPIVAIGPQLDAAPAASVEALVRWRHPSLGVLPPSSFVPGAEKSGLILPLGDAVLAIALRQLRDWLDAGAAPEWMSVNVSAVELRTPDFAQTVLRRLAAAGIAPGRLVIELTEGTLIDGSTTVMDGLHRLVDGGVGLAIDDFGIGYSSLRYLRDIPVQMLKIDRLFVQDIVDNPRDASIVSAIVSLARTLRLRTVAEGIETEAQLRVVRELGCDYGQGWLFGHPA